MHCIEIEIIFLFSYVWQFLWWEVAWNWKLDMEVTLGFSLVGSYASRNAVINNAIKVFRWHRYPPSWIMGSFRLRTTVLSFLFSFLWKECGRAINKSYKERTQQPHEDRDSKRITIYFLFLKGFLRARVCAVALKNSIAWLFSLIIVS